MKQLTLIVFLLFSIAAISVSCDKGLTPIPAKTPPGHSTVPAQDMMADRPAGTEVADAPKRTIVEPDFVKGAWKAVKLQLVDKQSGESSVLIAPLNQSTPVPGSDLTVEVTHFFPAFLMTADAISSVSNDATNPAAFTIVHEKGTELMHHWLFAKMPQVHGLQHDRWSLVLLEGIPAH